ncbi:MAG: Asp-tRNA(Asn)/Glu-tRNA(Gln) amidotransferase subunit GatA, partial [Desulfobacterales bacterium]|nr:Asp-tRNA(Asn)/Glu-tRNA(Gln) amidotransferase subunit GatA [Desulfobacterales bacterium]
YDSTVIDQPVPEFHSYSNKPAESITVGVPREYFGKGVDEGVSKMVWKALKGLESQGVKLVE